MSYGQMNGSGHVTMINELPELNALENGPMMGVGAYDNTAQHQFPAHGAGLPPHENDQYSKFIRSSHRMNPQSGMGSMIEQEYQPEMAMIEPPQPKEHSYQPMYNCLDIANHVQQCPICSRFYNNDRTVYIIAIVVLSIVCLLLLKRVLDV